MDSSDSSFELIPIPPEKIKIKWNQVVISENKLIEEFRVSTRNRLKSGNQTTFNCVFGATKMKCPVRVMSKSC